MSYANESARIGAQPWQWVEFEVERCGLTYGLSPCAAQLLSGVVEDKCFNSWATCQDRDNFDSSEFWIRFCEPVERLPMNFPFATDGLRFFLPFLARVSHDPVRLDPGKSLGVRAALTFTLQDAPHHDIGIDKYVDDRSYDPMQQGLMIAKLRARFPHFIGRRVRWYQGYLTDNPTLEDFQMREFILETFAGPNSRGQFTVSARDPLKLTSEDRAQAPRRSTGVLAFDIADTGDPGTVEVSTTDTTQYPGAGGYIFINGEGFTYSVASVTGDETVTLYGVTRELPTGYLTDQQSHSAGDRVQLGLYLDGRFVDVLRELLIDYAPNFRAEWIPFPEWEADHDTWLGTSSIRRLIAEPEGVDKIIDEMIEQTMTWGVWWDEYARVVRYRSLHPADIGDVIPELNDDQHLLAGSVNVEAEPKRHINEIQILYGQIDPTGRRDARENYARGFVQVDADSQFPQGLRFAAGGAPGYSRYVFREHSEGVVPTLVEGPLEGAVRCQDEALPCSYLELKALHESGAEPPPELQMSAAEVAELVAQLDELQAFAEAHRDIDAACAAGFVSDRIQTPNMGTHLYRIDWIVDGFDPARPEILLYARADDQLPAGALGQCENGTWNGEPMQLVGTAFIIPPQVIGADHPDTFVGPLDNWHIHYNLCRGNSTGRDTFVPRSECLASGGDFSEALGWMLHAWVDTEHDNQLGVFSMWNPTIAPLLDGGTIRDQREVRGSDFPDGAEQSLIADFLYTGDLTIQPGQPLFFNNVDAVPHTVTAGTPDAPGETFDSGLLNPGSNYSVEFDEPGVYSLFCALHPDMVATITVEGG